LVYVSIFFSSQFPGFKCSKQGAAPAPPQPAPPQQAPPQAAPPQPAPPQPAPPQPAPPQQAPQQAPQAAPKAPQQALQLAKAPESMKDHMGRMSIINNLPIHSNFTENGGRSQFWYTEDSSITRSRVQSLEGSHFEQKRTHKSDTRTVKKILY
jgi:hypothetical protein